MSLINKLKKLAQDLDTKYGPGTESGLYAFYSTFKEPWWEMTLDLIRRDFLDPEIKKLIQEAEQAKKNFEQAIQHLDQKILENTRDV